MVLIRFLPFLVYFYGLFNFIPGIPSSSANDLSSSLLNKTVAVGFLLNDNAILKEILPKLTPNDEKTVKTKKEKKTDKEILKFCSNHPNFNVRPIDNYWYKIFCTSSPIKRQYQLQPSSSEEINKKRKHKKKKKRKKPIPSNEDLVNKINQYAELIKKFHVVAKGSAKVVFNFIEHLHNSRSLGTRQDTLGSFWDLILAKMNFGYNLMDGFVSSQTHKQHPRPDKLMYPDQYQYQKPFENPYKNPYEHYYENSYGNPYGGPYENPYDNPYKHPYKPPFENPYINPKPMYDNHYEPRPPYDNMPRPPFQNPYKNPYENSPNPPYTNPYPQNPSYEKPETKPYPQHPTHEKPHKKPPKKPKPHIEEETDSKTDDTSIFDSGQETFSSEEDSIYGYRSEKSSFMKSFEDLYPAYLVSIYKLLEFAANPENEQYLPEMAAELVSNIRTLDELYGKFMGYVEELRVRAQNLEPFEKYLSSFRDSVIIPLTREIPGVLKTMESLIPNKNIPGSSPNVIHNTYNFFLDSKPERNNPLPFSLRKLHNRKFEKMEREGNVGNDTEGFAQKRKLLLKRDHLDSQKINDNFVTIKKLPLIDRKGSKSENEPLLITFRGKQSKKRLETLLNILKHYDETAKRNWYPSYWKNASLSVLKNVNLQDQHKRKGTDRMSIIVDGDDGKVILGEKDIYVSSKSKNNNDKGDKPKKDKKKKKPKKHKPKSTKKPWDSSSEEEPWKPKPTKKPVFYSSEEDNWKPKPKPTKKPVFYSSEEDNWKPKPKPTKKPAYYSSEEENWKPKPTKKPVFYSSEEERWKPKATKKPYYDSSEENPPKKVPKYSDSEPDYSEGDSGDIKSAIFPPDPDEISDENDSLGSGRKKDKNTPVIPSKKPKDKIDEKKHKKKKHKKKDKKPKRPTKGDGKDKESKNNKNGKDTTKKDKKKEKKSFDSVYTSYDIYPRPKKRRKLRLKEKGEKNKIHRNDEISKKESEIGKKDKKPPLASKKMSPINNLTRNETNYATTNPPTSNEPRTAERNDEPKDGKKISNIKPKKIGPNRHEQVEKKYQKIRQKIGDGNDLKLKNKRSKRNGKNASNSKPKKSTTKNPTRGEKKELIPKMKDKIGKKTLPRKRESTHDELGLNQKPSKKLKDRRIPHSEVSKLPKGPDGVKTLKPIPWKKHTTKASKRTFYKRVPRKRKVWYMVNYLTGEVEPVDGVPVSGEKK